METTLKRKYYTARYDKMFKAIFVSDDKELIDALLSDCLGEEVHVIKFLNTELGVKKADERGKRLDCLVKAKDKYINIEINTNFGKVIRVRNFNYFTAFYSSAIKQGEEYDYTTEYLHIDISFGMGSSGPIKNEYVLKSKEYGDTYIDNFRIMVYNMDKLKEVWYHEGGKGIKGYKHLLMMDLQPEELDELGNDLVVKKYKERLEEMNDIDTYIPPISREQDAIMLENTFRRYYREEGLKEGREEGLKQGIEQGIEQKQLEVIKNLYNKGIDIDTIADVVSLTKEKVENIIKEL